MGEEQPVVFDGVVRVVAVQHGKLDGFGGNKCLPSRIVLHGSDHVVLKFCFEGVGVHGFWFTVAAVGAGNKGESEEGDGGGANYPSQ